MTTTQPMSPDQLNDWLANNLDQFPADETLTPFTLTARHPGLGHLRADNALNALHAAGLLHHTSRNAVYSLRADLPTSGNGHVWLRINNRGGAPVEVISDQPRPADNPDDTDANLTWKCHGCGHGNTSSGFHIASKFVEKHADECRAQHLGN
jgi:hypothetical protein